MITTKPCVNSTDRFTVAKAAKVLECNRSTLYIKIKNKEVKYHITPNGKIYLSGADIIAFWNTQCF